MKIEIKNSQPVITITESINYIDFYSELKDRWRASQDLVKYKFPVICSNTVMALDTSKATFIGLNYLEPNPDTIKFKYNLFENEN